MTNNPTIDGVSRELLERCLSALDCRVAASKPVRALRVELRYFLDTQPHEHEWDINAEGTATVCYCGARSSDVPAVERQPIKNASEVAYNLQSENSALQSTIARLEARVTQLESEKELMLRGAEVYKERIAELESGRGEPVAYLCVAEGARWLQYHSDLHKPWNPEDVSVTPLYTAPPAPVAVVLPELESAFENWWEEDGQYCRAGGGSYEKTFAYRAYEAAIDATAALNGPAK